MNSEELGQTQTAYRVLCASSEAALDHNVGDLWDSGKVEESHPFNVVYRGRELRSAERIYWKVLAFDVHGRSSPWSPAARFEMGLLHPDDWKGQWINDGKKAPARDEDFYKDDPAPLFRKEFHLSKRPLSARLYVSGLGYYESSLNGSKVGDHVLDPGWTKFGTRVEYSVFDVTRQLHTGSNCLGVTLGNGWYNPLPMKLFGSFNLREHLDIGRPRFIALLRVELEDSSIQELASDSSWKVGTGEVRFDNIYLGEIVDSRLEPKGWSKPGFDDKDWSSPSLAEEPIGALQCESQPPIRITEKIPAVKMTEPRTGVFIYDFGKEFSGWPSVSVHASSGARIQMRYGELLNPDGSLNVMTSAAGQIKSARKSTNESIGGPGAPVLASQGDTYIARGGEEETYTPRFTFHGFRYMEITGISQPPALDKVVGLRLNSDVQSAGFFECSNESFNEIQKMCRNTFLSNIFSVQSDCPHRERLGYGGDMVGTSEAFMLNFDMAGFYAKTVRDFGDATLPDGMLTDTAPFIGIQYCGVGWALAHPLITHQLRRYYGDVRTTEEQYEVAKKWLDLVADKYPDGIVSDGLSDHESLESTPSPVMVTPLYYQAATILADMASELNRREDRERFEKLANKIRSAYLEHYLDPDSGTVGIASQASQSFALYSGILDNGSKPKVLSTLLDRIRGDGRNHLTTGLMGTKFMLDSLSRCDQSEDAYAIVDQPDFPGWKWMLKNGATTLWEHWEKEEYTFSHCHPMFGSVSQWFINWLGGIQPSQDAIGFDKVEIRPQFVKGLNWAKTSHDCMFGRISSNWKWVGDRIELDLDLPVGVTTRVFLPLKDINLEGHPLSHRPDVKQLGISGGNTILSVGSGRYRFSFFDWLASYWATRSLGAFTRQPATKRSSISSSETWASRTRTAGKLL